MRRVLRLNRDDSVDAVFLMVLGTLALLGFSTTYDGWSFLFVGVVGLVVGAVVGHVAVALRQPMITVAALTVAVFFLLGGAVVLRQAPTVGSVTGLADAGVHAWKRLLTTLPPVDGRGPLLVVPYVLGLLCGAGGHTMARRLRMAAGPLIAPVLVLVAVILLGAGEPAALLPHGVVFGGVALCWAAVRSGRSRPAASTTTAGRVSRAVTGAAVLGVAAAAAAFAGPAVTGGADRLVLRDYVAPPLDLGAYASPLVGFRKYTKDANQLYDQTLFTVRGLPAGTPMRIATLDDYSGTVWAASAVDAAGGGFQRVGPRIVRPGATGTEATMTVTIEAAYAASDDVSAWLPNAGTVTGVEFGGPDAELLTDTFRWNLATSAGVVGARLRAGDTVAVRSLLGPAPANAPAGDPANWPLPPDAQPAGRPAVTEAASGFVATRAAKWAGSSSDPIEARLRAVATHLRDSGAYSSGGPGETQFLPGHSLGRLTAFLNADRAVGDDEQYAAVFALVANSLGMPARVVFGAVPAADGTVRGQDVHPWVELHVADRGWLAIPHTEFTPDVSKKPDTTPPQQIQNTDASIVPPPNTVRTPDSLTDSSQVDSQAMRRGDGEGRGFTLPAWLVAVLIWAGPPVLVIALVLGALVAIKARRRALRRTRGDGATRFAAGWREVLDHARDLGATVPGGRTRAEQATALGDPELRPLAAAADTSVFGPGQPDSTAVAAYWQAVDRTRRRMSLDVPRWRRWLAAVSVRSLRAPRPTSRRDPIGRLATGVAS